MKKTFIILLTVSLMSTFALCAGDYPSGLPGLFTINAHGGQVRFAQGNLQYLAALNSTAHPDGTHSTGTWRFASNQYESVGSKNKNISADNADWIDLFGWATSGYDNTANDPCAIFYQPYSSSNDSTDCVETNVMGYGPSTDQAFRGMTGASAYYDWGVYNTISNSEEGSTWRTLTYGEWFYLLYSRPNAENLRSHATIPNLHGYILLPDNWETPEGLTFVPQASDWETNTYSGSQWTKMEQAGAVFLPASGQRRDNQCGWGNTHGFYWTSSAANSRQAQVIHFNDTTIFANSRYQRSYGNSVRLVRDVNLQSDTLSKFKGFDIRGSRMGDWIYNNGGFQNVQNLTIEETDSIYHKYTLYLTTGGQECSFSLGGVRFEYKNSASNKIAFKTTNTDIRPDGKDRKIIIPTNPGDEILISVADTNDYKGLKTEGVESSTIDLNVGENILQATGDSIVITTSNVAGEEVKVRIDAILCVAHHNVESGLINTMVVPQAKKILRNGQLYILINNKTYTLTGCEVK